MDQQSDDITIRITKNEALVLFDYLSKFNEEKTANDFQHPADQIVLWNIEAVLEAQLPEVFKIDYQELVDNARKTFRIK